MKPLLSQVVHGLFFLTVTILVVFGFGSLFRANGNPEGIALLVFYALIMFGDAAILLFCALQLNQRRKPIYLFAVIILCMNISLAIFDQFGLVDLLFLLLNLITLIALSLARKEFLPA